MPTNETLRQRVITALRALGNTKDDIAANLESRNIRGDHSCGTCPIAQYLYQEFQGPNFKVQASSISILSRCGYETIHFYDNYLTQVKEFILAFDGFHYPRLEWE